MPITPHTESGMALALIATPVVFALVWFFNAYKLGRINKVKLVVGMLTGVLVGVASGLGFKSVTVGAIAGACGAVLFAHLFSKFKNKRD